jgi:hypothetical protein
MGTCERAGLDMRILLVCDRVVAAGDRINVPCPDCGHLINLHVGCETCPVCELLAINPNTD